MRILTTLLAALICIVGASQALALPTSGTLQGSIIHDYGSNSDMVLPSVLSNPSNNVSGNYVKVRGGEVDFKDTFILGDYLTPLLRLDAVKVTLKYKGNRADSRESWAVAPVGSNESWSGLNHPSELDRYTGSTFVTQSFWFNSSNMDNFGQVASTGQFNLAFSEVYDRNKAFKLFCATLDVFTVEQELYPTPEPATMVLAGMGLFGLAATRRRKR